ncbi:MAG TPA: hypothetical protein VML00_08430, partial [Bacteroidota bacterium]|nr:hypothetical protein [Bacteroidota bacterium]
VIPYVGANFPGAVCIAAARGINMAALTAALTALLEGTVAEETLECGPGDYDIVSRAHEAGEILEERFDSDGIRLRVRMHRTRLEQLKKSLAERRNGRGAS